ncbi:MAG: ATP-binding cassette domain-containing protein [Deltaproteobacteria bacterium]|nr:ATP-binding cassette domain-containing protein [Deltaproteobacteria bacterium]
MICTTDVTIAYGKRVLFKDVNIKFAPGNCYGLIGANGAGKSTFLKILSGDIEPDSGTVSVGSRERIAVLKQEHFAFDEERVLNTVIMGHEKLYGIMTDREALYDKPDFSEEDGIRAGELEVEFAEMNGYEAEPEAAVDVLLLDEPTNNLDIKSIAWLEEFLYRFQNTVIVVSHDRYFMNQVCTHIADIDFGKISVYMGNYDFWYQASQLNLKQKQSGNKKITDRANELKAFIQRFSANASKSKQATSRKKLLEKLTIEDMPVSSRKYPFICFKPERHCGNMILEVDGLTKTIDGEKVLDNVSFIVNCGDKIALMGGSSLAKTTLFQILTGEMEQDGGTFHWGTTITHSYFPKEYSAYFNGDRNLIEWLLQFAPPTEGESFARTFLGRMLFSGEEALKKINVLSGGEKVRCMLSRMMLSESNVLMLDEPTNHLDLESITSLNNSLLNFQDVILFTSHDHEFVNTVANRIIEIIPGGVIDQLMTFDEYVERTKVVKTSESMLLKAA